MFRAWEYLWHDSDLDFANKILHISNNVLHLIFIWGVRVEAAEYKFTTQISDFYGQPLLKTKVK